VTVIPLALAQPGDLVACHSKGAVGDAIRTAERFRRDWSEDDKFSSEAAGDRWNHWAILGSCEGAPRRPENWTLIQAEGHGVTSTARLDTVAPGGHYQVVRLPPECNRIRVLDFAGAQVGSHYGFLTIASIVATLLSPRFVNVMLPGTWICSAVTAESLRFGGWLHAWPDIYQVSPAQLWCALTGGS
jgi:hypothetical protein